MLFRRGKGLIAVFAFRDGAGRVGRTAALAEKAGRSIENLATELRHPFRSGPGTSASGHPAGKRARRGRSRGASTRTRSKPLMISPCGVHFDHKPVMEAGALELGRDLMGPLFIRLDRHHVPGPPHPGGDLTVLIRGQRSRMRSSGSGSSTSTTAAEPRALGNDESLLRGFLDRGKAAPGDQQFRWREWRGPFGRNQLRSGPESRLIASSTVVGPCLPRTARSEGRFEAAIGARAGRVRVPPTRAVPASPGSVGDRPPSGVESSASFSVRESRSRRVRRSRCVGEPGCVVGPAARTGLTA